MRPSSRRRLRVEVLCGLLAVSGCGREAGTPLGIVVVVVDTLRADRLSVYGHDRETSPVLEQIAAEGAVFEQAISHTSWTLPAFIGLLGGVYPDRSAHSQRLRRSLVEQLRESGRATAAFTEGGYVSRAFGIDLGFDQFESHESSVRLFRRGGRAEPQSSTGIEQTFDTGLAWLREHAGTPFFLMLHTYEVHTPYERREFAKELDSGTLPELYTLDVLADVSSGALAVGETEQRYVRALYDGGVLIADTQIGRLVALLDELGIADHTLLVVTSDHGEELGDRDPKRLGVHGGRLYDSLLHIPLILRYPDRVAPGVRIATQVRLVDVLPTVLDFAGLVPPGDLDGQSLVPVLDGRERRDRPALAQIFLPKSDTVRSLAVRDGGFKLIVNAPPLEPGEPSAELYHVAIDPDESENRAVVDGERKEALLSQLREIRDGAQRRTNTVPTEGPSEEVRQQLRALGYVE